MKRMRSGSKSIMTIMLIAVIFLTYNGVLFLISGFADHGASFWISYVFMLTAFISLCTCLALLKSFEMQPRDWLFGFPILRHCFIYLVVELIASIIFMIADNYDCAWGVTFGVQLVILAIHLVFVISCFMAKATMDGVVTKIETKTKNIGYLKIEAEMVAEKAADPEVKAAYTKLAEDIRYSDPMSSEPLEELEQQILHMIKRGDDSILAKDKAGAIEYCNRASMLLLERNKKSKLYKAH